MDALFTRLRQELTVLYEPREAHAIALRVMEDGFGIAPVDIYADKVRHFSAEETLRLQAILQRLCDGEPLQYVLGFAWFAGQKFHTAPGVLIPRPETEELAEWVAAEWGSGAPRVLDAGTGSGCIAVTLARRLPKARVEAWDISDAALGIARRNASALGAEVDFRLRDMLEPPPADACFDVIVSNPPYVRESERAAMAQQVLRHEPHAALFVPDTDALRFYKALARMARTCLAPGGGLYLEINEALGAETLRVLAQAGLRDLCLRQDAFGKDRMAFGRQGAE